MHCRKRLGCAGIFPSGKLAVRSIAADNFRSRRVMEKLGMMFERTGESVKFDGSETFKTNIFSKILNDDKI